MTAGSYSAVGNNSGILVQLQERTALKEVTAVLNNI
jgi:hypothetical protein